MVAQGAERIITVLQSQASTEDVIRTKVLVICLTVTYYKHE